MIRHRVAHALRSVLSQPVHTLALMLCAATGVLAATTVQGLATGVGRQLSALIADWRNQRLISAYGVRVTGTGGADCEKNTLTHSDLDALNASLAGRATFYPRVVGSALVEDNGSHRRMNIRAAGLDYFRLTEWYTRFGEPLTAEDEEHASKVCVLGSQLADQLAGGPSLAVGRLVHINGMPFRVKGVLEARGKNVLGEDVDQTLFVPVSTAEKRVFCVEGLRGIGYAVFRPDDDGPANAQIAALLRSRHRLRNGADDDFRITDPESLRRMYAGAFRAKERLIALLTAIAGVIAIGIITNVTLLAVQQRRAEIGLKRALGATRLTIVAEIAGETTLIAIGGAVIGVLAFAVLATIVSRLTRLAPQFSTFPLAFSWPTVVVAAAVAVVIGGAAAIVPGRAAVRLNPAEALRP